MHAYVSKKLIKDQLQKQFLAVSPGLSQREIDKYKQELKSERDMQKIQTSAKGSVPPITMLGRNLSIPTGDGNSSFRATNDASVVMRYAVSAAYPVYKTQ